MPSLTEERKEEEKSEKILNISQNTGGSFP